MRKFKIRLNKKKFRKRIRISFLIIFVCVITIVAFTIFNQKNKIEISSVIRNGISINDPKAAEAIKSYFDTYYYSLAKLKTQDLSSYFYKEDQKSYENALINQASLDYLISYRKASMNDLAFNKCTFGLTYTDIDTDENGNLHVKLNLDEAVSFKFLEKITSYMCGISHEFVLKKISDGYKILNHNVDDSIYTEVEKAFEASMDSDKSYSNDALKELMEQTKANLINSAASSLTAYEKDRQAFNSNPAYYSYSNDTDNSYNRDKAVAYALKWVGETKVIRNSDLWVTYDDLGGNCCNFVSQCLNAGGIPMDTEGEEIWKWYDDTPDKTNNDAGRSPSWTGVGDFYEYCAKNKNFGLSADAGGNFYAGNIGDVIIMASGDNWSHVVIITQLIKDKEGHIIDYLINSNTSDRKNYPLSAYGSNTMQIIRIKGWNN